MAEPPTPTWQPITALPLVAELIDGAHDDARTQLENLTEARGRPHVLDEALVNRVIRSYSEQAEFLPVYQEQLERWERLDLTTVQQSEVARLKAQFTSLRVVLCSLLSLAHELKSGTIDAILNQGDAEVALDFLLRKPRP